MHNFLKTASLILFCLLNITSSAFADNLQEGVKAYEKNDFTQAYQFYSKACEERNADGCFKLAVMISNGRGVEQDALKSKEFFKKYDEYKYETSLKENEKLKQTNNVILILKILLFFILCLVIIVKYPKKRPDLTEESDENFKLAQTKLNDIIKEFNGNQKIKSLNQNLGISVNSETHEVLFWDVKSYNIYPYFNLNTLKLKYSDIISSEILEDGISTTKTNRISQIGNAIVGGALLGGIGVIVGGLSGKQETSKSIATSLSLKITTNNIQSPIYIITFLDKPTIKTNNNYQKALQNITHWHGVFDAIINQANLNEEKKNFNPQPMLIADELQKLIILKNEGVLTEEEFNIQKSKLLT